MSLKSKIEAVIYASEEPVTLLQLAGLLGDEAQVELDAEAARQTQLALGEAVANEAETEEMQQQRRWAGPSTATPSSEPLGEPVSKPAGEPAGEPAMEGGPKSEDAPEASPAAETPLTEADEGVSVAAEGARETERERRLQRERERAVREHIQRATDLLIREYAESDRGMEVREVAGGYRMGTKPEYHDAVRGFVRSLKPAMKLTLPALETLAVVAYKQPVTAAEISEIRGVDSAGVLGGLMTRKLIATAGRKQVIGRPMLYRTTKEFLLRFGLKDVHELPSMEEFEKMAGELDEQEDLPMEDAGEVVERANVRGDAEHIREANERGAEPESSPASEAGDNSL